MSQIDSFKIVFLHQIKLGTSQHGVHYVLKKFKETRQVEDKSGWP